MTRAMPGVPTLANIERALGSRPPRLVTLEGSPARAAVAMLLEERRRGIHVFFIHRAHDERDPWSGHMGFPGGFMDDGDRDLRATVVREVREETRIDLDRSARWLGTLDEIQGVARGRQLPLVISPFVLALREPVAPVPNEEIQGMLWVPLSFLADRRNESTTDWTVDGRPMSLPAFLYEGRTIWGLTFRMLQNFLGVIGVRETSQPA